MAGIITDKSTKQTLSFASIQNVMKGKIVISKQNGDFIIDVSEGNVLSFSANGYYTDTITVTASILEKANLQIVLKPLPATLENVTVTSNYNHYNRYQNDSTERRKQFLLNVGENKIPTIGRANDMGFGIALNLDHFSKREKTKRDAKSLFEITEEQAYVNYRWNETVVKKYTSFSNDKLTAFIQDSRPAYDWLRSHATEEDLLYYINSRLKKMKKG